jgi:SAM-dependent methyltransferase
VWSATPNQWVEKLTAGLPVGRALDLAGGEGRNALWLADRGWQATVVDFSQVALDKARVLASKRFGANSERLTTIRADLLTYRPVVASFDLVLLVYLQLPPNDRRTVVRSAATALAPGGRLLVVAHHSKNLSAGVGGPQDPDLLYTAEDIAADLTGTELAIERSDSLLRAVATDGGRREAIDAVLIACRAHNATTATRETDP